MKIVGGKVFSVTLYISKQYEIINLLLKCDKFSIINRSINITR